MKVYAIIYDYEGCEEYVEKLFSTIEKAAMYIYEKIYERDEGIDLDEYLERYDTSIVEWELDTNKQIKIN